MTGEDAIETNRADCAVAVCRPGHRVDGLGDRFRWFEGRRGCRKRAKNREREVPDDPEDENEDAEDGEPASQVHPSV